MMRRMLVAIAAASISIATGAAAQSDRSPAIHEWLPVKADPIDHSIRDPYLKTNPNSWFIPADYAAIAPPGTEVDHELIDLTIDATGKPTACHSVSYGKFIVDVEGTADTTARICPIIVKRGQFGYALDSDGNKVAAPMRLRLEIQGRDPDGALYLALPSAPNSGMWGKLSKSAQLLNPADVSPTKPGPVGMPGFRIGVSAQGAATFCKIVKTSGSDLVDVNSCRSILAKARFQPALDRENNPTDTEFWLMRTN